VHSIQWKSSKRNAFVPNLIRFFELQKISKYARETWEFVNLYSKTRGVNRFLALLEAFRLLEQRPEVKARGMKLPDLRPIRQNGPGTESKLGNPFIR
jgi:hypothetical protein